VQTWHQLKLSNERKVEADSKQNQKGILKLTKIKFRSTQISQQGDAKEDGCRSSLAPIPRSHLNYSQ